MRLQRRAPCTAVLNGLQVLLLVAMPITGAARAAGGPRISILTFKGASDAIACACPWSAFRSRRAMTVRPSPNGRVKGRNRR